MAHVFGHGWFEISELTRIISRCVLICDPRDSYGLPIRFGGGDLFQRRYIRRWVKNYSHYKYMFCSWLYCWLGMTKYTWSTPFLPLWYRCDLHSPFPSWVFCHKHGHPQFNLHQRRAEGSNPFLWAEGVPGVEMHRMMSVQNGNSVMSQRIVC